MARSAPDGYTFLFGAGSQLVLAPLLQKVGYDPDKDLIPITEFGTGPQILGVKGDMPVNTLQEFIDYAKARPGKLTYAGVGMQTVTAIAAGVLIARTGLEMTLVPYKGGVQAVGDLLAGHVDMYFGNASEMLPHLNGGKIKLLAVATPSRIPQAPDLPAVAETFPGFQFGSWNGFMAPAGTPKEIVDKLVEASIEAVTRHQSGRSWSRAASCLAAPRRRRWPNDSRPTSSSSPTRSSSWGSRANSGWRR